MQLRSGPIPQSKRVVRPYIRRFRRSPPEATAAPATKRARLTTTNLKHHTRQAKVMVGRKNTSNKLDGGDGGSVSRSRSSKRSKKSDAQTVSSETPTTSSKGSGSSTKTKNSDPLFGKRLSARDVRHGFFGIRGPKLPPDAAEVRQRLERERDSEPPDENAFLKYTDFLRGCDTEDEIRDGAWRHVAKEAPSVLEFQENINGSWNKVDNHLTYDFSVPKPDKSLSYRIESYPATSVEHLGSALQPSTGSMAMPHYCVEVKTPKADFSNGIAQAAYDGAVMVDSALQVHEYLQRPEAEFMDKTQALTVAYNGQWTHVFTNHATRGESSLEYHQSKIISIDPTLNLDEFRRARKVVRNCQDWSEEQERRKRDDLVGHEKARVAANADALAKERAKNNAKPTAVLISPPGSHVEQSSKRGRSKAAQSTLPPPPVSANKPSRKSSARPDTAYTAQVSDAVVTSSAAVQRSSSGKSRQAPVTANGTRGSARRTLGMS